MIGPSATWKSADSEQKVKISAELSWENLVIVVLLSVKPSPSQVLFEVSIPSSSESMYGMRVSLYK